MFYQKSENNYRQAIEGIRYKTLVYGQNTSLSEFHLQKGSVMPNHSHPHEQTGYMVSGHMSFIIDGKKYEAIPGNSWCIPAHIEHGVEVLEDSIVIEIFSPVRDEYL